MKKNATIAEQADNFIKQIKKYLKDKQQYENIDELTLITLRDNIILIDKAREEIEKHGLLVVSSKGDLVSNKAIKIKQDATIRVEKCLEILGIQNRQRYKGKEIVTEEEPTALELFIKGQS